MPVNARSMRPRSRGLTSPRQIAGLALWVDASKTETLFPVSDAMIEDDFSPGVFTGVNPHFWVSAANPNNTVLAGRVESLVDLTGNQPAFSATNYGNVNITAPLLVANAIGGQPAMRFNGTTDGLVTSSVSSAEVLTMCVVAIVRKNAASVDMNSVIGIEDYNDTSYYVSVAPNSMQLGVSSSAIALRAAAPTPVILVTTYTSGGVRNVYHNGRLVATGVDTQAMYEAQFISLGRGGVNVAPYGGNPASCDIAEALAFDITLTTAQINQLTLYYANKYKIVTDVSPASQTLTAVNAPTEVAGCVGWYDAADSATLFDAQSGGSVVTTNGATVARWQDKSGGGRHLTQSTANTGLPTLSTSALAGRNVVAFGGTGTGAGFTMTSPVSRATHTVIAVYYSDTGGDATASIINDGTGGYGLLIARGAVTFLEGSSGNSTVGSGRIQSQLSASVVAVGPAISSWLHAETPSLFQNGSSIGSGTTSGSVSLSRVGYYNVANTIFRVKGYIAELVIFDNALSAVDRARVEKYLQQKWSTTAVPDPPVPPVAAWLDNSGNQRHAVQATAALRPSYITNSLNGKPALTGGGVGSPRTMVVSAFPYYNAHTAMFVFRASALNQNIYNRGSITTDRPQFVTSGSPLLVGALKGGANAGAVNSTLAYTASQWSVGGLLTDVGTLRCFLNGVYGTDATGNTESWSDTSILRLFSRTDTTLSLNGGIAEFVYYDRQLTAPEVSRLAAYLSRKYGITLNVIPTVANADAQDWVNRVYANGGTVSTSTAQAVDTFCGSIDAAGLRDRFYRLSLLCGDNLTAARVPLYRSTAFGGAGLGSTIDANNSFAAGDYSLTGGIKCGTSRSLDTGLAPDSADYATGHIAVWIKRTGTFGRAGLITSWNTGYTAPILFIEYTSSTLGGNWAWYREQAIAASAITGNHLLMTRRSTTDQAWYQNGALGEQTTVLTTTTATSSVPFHIGARRVGTDIEAHADENITHYSIGRSMTASQITSFYAAVSTFMTTLGR